MIPPRDPPGDDLESLLRHVAAALRAPGGSSALDVIARLRDTDFSRPAGAAATLDTLAALLRRSPLRPENPCNIGMFHPPPAPLAVAAGALAAGFDPQLALRASAPGAVAAEAHVLGWIAGRFGYPAAHHACFTSGASESLRDALLYALARAHPVTLEDGLASLAGRVTVYASREAHASLEKVLRGCGLGARALRRVRCDGRWRMRVDLLRAQLHEDRAAGRLPLAVVATAGTTNTGAIDPLRPLASLCADEGLWLHADAAWAGAAALSPRTAGLLDGLGLADSIAWDAHKWLPLPIAAGALFTRHPGLPGRAFAVDAPYVPRGGGDGATPYRESSRWSRGFIGAGLFAWLAAEGADGAAAWIDATCERGDALRDAVTRAGWALIAPTALPLVCFTHPAMRAGRIAPQRVASTLRRAGVAWLNATRVDGRLPALHGAAMHPGLSASALDALGDALREVARAA